MATIKSTDENFDNLLKENKYLLCDFWASWCSPCLLISPHLESLSEELKDKCVISKHNIEEEPNVPVRFGVTGIPTMILFKDSKIKSTKIGATTKSNIKSWLEENLV